MTNNELNEFSKSLQRLSTNYEEKAWTVGIKLLRTEFKLSSIENPNHYLKLINDLNEFSRQSRVLFLYSVLNLVCKEESKLYHFETPYQTSLKYDAVMKKDDTFYIRDEDGHFREIFQSIEFMQFIDDQYWRLYEED